MHAAEMGPARPGLAAGASLLDRPALLWALAAYGVATFLAFQGSFAEVVRALRLPDNDDAMRLLQVRDWIAGQGWFDTAQHRYLPPAGGALHWSRLVDVPIAGMILLLRPLLGQPLAEGVTAAAWPVLVFLAYLGLVFAGTRRLLGPRAGCLAVFLATQMGQGSLFSPGRIDHHNVQVIVVLAAALGLILPGSRPGRRAALSGGLAALSLAIGLETLPAVATLAACSALLWVARGRDEAASFAGFGLGLAGGGALLFLAQTDPARWAAPACDVLSPPWLGLAGGGALAALGLAAAGEKLPGPAHRAAAAALAGALLLALFALAAPACLRGPYADLPDLARTLWLDEVSEAKPLLRLVRTAPLIPLTLVLPLAAAAAIAAAAARGEPRLRRPFAVLAGLLASSVLVTLVQIRGVYVGAAVLPVVGGYALDRMVGAMLAPTPLRRRLGQAALCSLLFGKLWAAPVAAASLLAGGGERAQAPGRPSTGSWSCNDGAALAPLNRLPAGLVLAPIDLGANLLLKTHHAIVAAPYHRNPAGIVAGAIAVGGSEAEMRGQVERFGADYVVLCRPWLAPDAASPAFAERLAAGQGAAWLDPVAATGDILAWRVRRAAAR